MSITLINNSCYIYTFPSYLIMRGIPLSIVVFMLCMLTSTIGTYFGELYFKIKLRKKGLGCDDVRLRFINIKCGYGVV